MLLTNARNLFILCGLSNPPVIHTGVTNINIEDILKTVHEYSGKPPLFEPGEEKFWDDDHISIGMLQAHLSQEHEAASRKTQAIEAQVEHLTFTGILREGDRILDPGCGPGLYASRLCRKGLKVTGVDFSRRSIEYAIKYAVENDLDIDYRLIDFFSIDFSGEFDAVMQIYGELNTFSDEKRDSFLALIHKALKPEGLFIIDVTTRKLRKKEGGGNRWYLFEGEIPDEYYPDGYPRKEVFAVREDYDYYNRSETLVQLTDDATLQPIYWSFSRNDMEWAPGDRTISFKARRWGELTPVEGGLYTADLVYSAEGNIIGLAAPPTAPTLT